MNESIVQEWFNEDEQYKITDSSILDMVRANSDEVDNSDEEEGESGDIKIIHTDGAEALEKALHYVEQLAKATPADVMLL